MVTKYMHYAYKVKITNGVRKEDLTDDDCAPAFESLARYVLVS